MAKPLPMLKYQVQDCYLQIKSSGLPLPVARFDISFITDTIPQATVIPAIGRSLGVARTAAFKDLRGGEAVSLILVVDDVEHMLLDGYISDLGFSDNASTFSRRLSATITVKHNAAKLAGAPSSGFVYAGKMKAGESLSMLSYMKNQTQPFDGGTGTVKAQSLLPVASWVNQLENSGGTSALFPGTVLKNIVLELFSAYNSAQLSADELESMIRTYDPANLTRIRPEPSGFIRMLAPYFTERWQQANTWEALTQTASWLMLSIIPFNTGFYIADPYSLDTRTMVTLSADEYCNLDTQRIGRLDEPVDGVTLISPGQVAPGLLDECLFSFPKPKPTDNTPAPGSYYHFKPYPVWMQPMINYINGAAPKPGKAFGPPAAVDPAAAKLVDLYKTTGALLARSYYARLRNEKAAFYGVTTPFRTDLMPGTIIRIQPEAGRSDTFIDTDLIGMIGSTKIQCDTTSDQPSLSMEIHVMAVRNAVDNANTENVTMDGNPVYEGRWVGTDLNGDLLGPAPASKTPYIAPPKPAAVKV